MMRGLSVWAALLATLASFAGSTLAGEPDAWRIEAGQVETLHGPKAQVVGSFIVHAPDPMPPDAPPRMGGACLVADLVPFGVGLASCETTSDCNAAGALQTDKNPALQGSSTYCAAPDGSDEPRRCWTRPGPPQSHCRRSIDGFRLDPGTHRIGPVDADPMGRGGPVPRWAVFACLAADGHERACGEPDSVHRQISLTPESAR